MYRRLVLCLSLIVFSFNSRSQSLSGTDYWFTFPENYSNDSYSQNILIIISSHYASGTVTFPLPAPLSFSFTVVPGDTAVLYLPIRSNAQTDGTIEKNGFHIISDSAITVYANNYRPASVDGETLLPTSKLGTDYVVTSRLERKNSSFLARATVVGTQNLTSVTITPSAFTTAGNPAGVPYTININAGETYTLAGNAGISNIGYDSLSGTHITSTKPIVVIGHTATSMGCGTIDGYMNEMLPVNIWGTKFITANVVKRNKFSNKSMSDFIEITAGATGAAVTITSYLAAPVVKTLGPYSSCFFQNTVGTAPDPGEANFVISSNNPIQVTQYAQGGYFCDGVTDTDPEATFIYPEAMWDNNYILACYENGTAIRSGLVIVINDSGSPLSGNFILDGGSIGSPTWYQIGTSTYKFCRLPLTKGFHSICNSVGTPFGMYIYTLGDAESYITQGGGVFKSCLSTVPLDLLKFSVRAESGNVSIEWKTTGKGISKKFSVEKSVNSIEFREIPSAIQSFTSGGIEHYSTNDKALTGENYYRLKLTAEKGEETFSEIKSVHVSPEFVEQVRIINNGSNIEVDYNLETETEVRAEIYNLNGQQLFSQLLSGKKGKNIFNLNTSEWPTGMYFMKLSGASGIYSAKIIIP